VTFDLTKAWFEVGKLYAREMSLGIQQQRGLDGSPYVPPKMSTLKARIRTLGTKTIRGTKGKSKTQNSSLKRLYVTGDLAKRGFSFMAANDQVRVFATRVPHWGTYYDSNPLLSDLIKWNSKGQPDLNPNVGSRAPLVFPTKPAEIGAMESTKYVNGILWREMDKQMRAAGTQNLKAQLNIG
jgi:hypothetical protein